MSSVVSLAAPLFTCVPGVASAKWTRIRTEHFLFIGDASEGDIRRVAQKLDQFREVLRRVLPGDGTKSPVPTVVIVCGSIQPPAPVLATYIRRDGQTTTGADGRLVAIELLPDGYTPK